MGNPLTVHDGSTCIPADEVNSPYAVTAEDKAKFSAQGFVRLKGVFRPETLALVKERSAEVVAKADKTSLEEDDAYAQAFVQDADIHRFAHGTRLARIAANLMGVRGVRLYHDQALRKQPGGGQTPWHADQYYFPLASDKAITAWIPLQPTPGEMGPLQFAVGSHKVDLGRHLGISGTNQHIIDQQISKGEHKIVSGAFALGEVSFHSGWTFHRADSNATETPREVFTIIYIDQDMRMVEPMNANQEADMQRWLPGVQPGEVCASQRNPVVWSANDSV